MSKFSWLSIEITVTTFLIFGWRFRFFRQISDSLASRKKSLADYSVFWPSLMTFLQRYSAEMMIHLSSSLHYIFPIRPTGLMGLIEDISIQMEEWKSIRFFFNFEKEYLVIGIILMIIFFKESNKLLCRIFLLILLFLFENQSSAEY